LRGLQEGHRVGKQRFRISQNFQFDQRGV